MDVQTEVEIPAADGLTMHGTFTPGQGGDGAAVLLLHMYGSDRSSWGPFAEAIAQSGISALALDLRGHGQTGGAEDWEQAQDDVARAVEWLRALPGIDPDRVGLAGASIGANLSLVQAAGNPAAVAAVALLSPGLDYFRVKIDGLAAQVGDKPLFLAAAEDDGYSAQTVRILSEESGGGAVLEIFEGSAHGTDLFSAHPELAERLFAFLQDSLAG
jgi:alpha-beta hydrolase superfamily lysophospholipase